MEKVKLSEICNINAGGTPARNKKEYWNHGNIPWCKISDLSDRYISKVGEYITEEGLNNSSAKLFKKGTILYTIFATIGEVAILNIDSATNQAIAGIEIKDNHIELNYLYYFLKSLKIIMQNKSRGVAQNNINLSILKNTEIWVPEKVVQVKIANKLDKVQEIIDIRKKQIEQLGELINSQFVEMFENKKYPKDEFINLSKEIYAGGDKPKDMSQIKKEEYLYPIFANGYENEGLQGYSKNYRTADESVTISARGTIGYCFIRKGKFTPIVRLITIVPNERVNVIYLKYAIDNLNIAGSGTSQAQLTVPNIKKHKIIVPPIDVQNKFAEFVKQIDKQKFELQRSLEEIQKLKESLMNKYFGE